jgi:hypothetical protein
MPAIMNTISGMNFNTAEMFIENATVTRHKIQNEKEQKQILPTRKLFVSEPSMPNNWQKFIPPI